VTPVDHIELGSTKIDVSSLKASVPISVKLVPVTGGAVSDVVLKFTSSNPAVATVANDGTVTSVSNGTTKITIDAEGVQASVDVTVKQVTATTTVSPKAISVGAIGESVTFTFLAVDAGGTKVTTPVVAWTSSDATIAVVDANGKATGKRAGAATITATVDGKSDAATFIVAPTAQFLLVQTNRAQINAGETAIVSAKIADAGGTPINDANATFTTTTPNVASVSGNVVTGLAGGTAHIVATAGTLSGSVDIKVVGEIITGGTLTVTPGAVEKLPNGTQQFTVTGGEGPFTWTVNGVAGGNSTYGTITSAGAYTAPASVPSPSTFDVCAVQATPSAQGCSHVTINPIPSGGADVIVFNDINMFDNNYGSPYATNRQLYQNLVSFSGTGPRVAQTGVMFHRGHQSRCGTSECRASDFSSMNTQLTTAGFTVVNVDTTTAVIGRIAPNIKAIFLLMPTTTYNVTEINNLKSFAAEGGRIIFVGERQPYYQDSGIAIENKFFLDMGAQMTNVGGDYACIYQMDAAHIRPHQVTQGLNGLSMACASAVKLGPNDYALVLDQRDATVVLAAVAKIDLTPLSGGEPSQQRMPARTTARTTTTPASPDEHSWGAGAKPAVVRPK